LPDFSWHNAPKRWWISVVRRKLGLILIL
jgi:hypothetical protein